MPNIMSSIFRCATASFSIIAVTARVKPINNRYISDNMGPVCEDLVDLIPL